MRGERRARRISIARGGGDGEGRKTPAMRFVKIIKYFVHSQRPIHAPSSQMCGRSLSHLEGAFGLFRFLCVTNPSQVSFYGAAVTAAACSRLGTASGELPLPAAAATGIAPGHRLRDIPFCVNYTY